MDISDLPYPDTSQFEHYGIDKRPSRIYIGREFLKFRYHENPSDDITVTKQNYVDEFFELVEGIELPFQKVYINQSTLTEVAVWLHRNQSELAAEKCLTEAFGESPLIIEPTTTTVFQSAIDAFVKDSNKDPNFGEYLDYATMQEAQIEHILTWDSDFCRFGEQITMLPHKMWNM